MVNLRVSRYEELEIFSGMDKQPHASQFINATSLATHRKNFADENIIYLSIEKAEGELIGYFILVVSEGCDGVEFRRILIDQNQRGVGQVAIMQMGNYCRMTIGVTRIWLDVYEDNERGKYIYEKLGYERFKTEKVGERLLVLA